MKAIDYYKSEIENFEEMSFEDRRYWLEYKCMDKDKMHTKATLKGLFRLKPAKDAKPVGSYTNDYRQEIDLYHAIDCVPMRNVSKKPRSEAQKQATKKLMAKTFKRSPKGKAVELCKNLIANKAVVIDTETTDLDGVAIQIAVVACDTKEVLYSSLIATDKPISQGAYNVHGINAEMLVGAPDAATVYGEVIDICRGRDVVAFNADFDFSVCKRTFGRDFGEGWTCAMYSIAVPVLGSTNKYGTISLSNALAYAGVKWRGQAHDASGDAIATADLIYKISTLQP
jgi:DNA polymerase III epsilon subunit-like protein